MGVIKAAQNAGQKKLTNKGFKTSLQLIGSSNAAFRKSAPDWLAHIDWRTEGLLRGSVKMESGGGGLFTYEVLKRQKGYRGDSIWFVNYRRFSI